MAANEASMAGWSGAAIGIEKRAGSEPFGGISIRRHLDAGTGPWHSFQFLPSRSSPRLVGFV